jgi:hypothetical protein
VVSPFGWSIWWHCSTKLACPDRVWCLNNKFNKWYSIILLFIITKMNNEFPTIRGVWQVLIGCATWLIIRFSFLFYSMGQHICIIAKYCVISSSPYQWSQGRYSHFQPWATAGHKTSSMYCNPSAEAILETVWKVEFQHSRFKFFRAHVRTSRYCHFDFSC